MLSKTSISSTLDELQLAFTAALPPMDNYCAKLALLETCGWIEEAMDELFLNCLTYKIKPQKDFDYIKKKIDENYGFDYSNNFRRVLTHTLGLWNIIKLEKRLNPVKFARLTSELGSLRSIRGAAAHTHSPVGVTLQYDAPTVMKQRLNRVYDGLEDIENVLLQMKLTKK